MKRIISIMVMLLAISLFFISCGKKATPSEVLTKAYESMFSGDLDSFMSCISGTDAEIKEAKLEFEAAAAEFKTEKITLKSIKTLKETIASDGETAVVEFEATLQFEMEEEVISDEVELVLVDGNWKIIDITE